MVSLTYSIPRKTRPRNTPPCSLFQTFRASHHVSRPVFLSVMTALESVTSDVDHSVVRIYLFTVRHQAFTAFTANWWSVANETSIRPFGWSCLLIVKSMSKPLGVLSMHKSPVLANYISESNLSGRWWVLDEWQCWAGLGMEQVPWMEIR